MALPAPASTPTLWPHEVRDGVASSGELRATVDVIDPRAAEYTAYDPVADTGGPGPAPVLIRDRMARVQVTGTPTADVSDEDGYASLARPRLVQWIDAPGDIEVEPGMAVRVTAVEEGGDPFIVGKTFMVEDASGSSSHALRSVRCWAVR